MTALAAAVSVLLVPSAGLAAAPQYAPLKNLERGDAQCFAWQPDSDAVGLAACDGSAAQGWTMAADGSYQRIRNAAAVAAGRDLCLRTHPDGEAGRVSLGTCGGDGYQSMRMWLPEAGVDGRLVLRNKYRSDLGRKTDVLASLAGGDDVAMRDAAGIAARWRYPLPVAAPRRPLSGSKSVLLMATHFNDAKPADPDAIRQAVFGDGDDYASLRRYLEVASRGKLTIDGTMLKDVDLGQRPATCDSGAIRDAARKAARARGVNPDGFDYLFVDISKLNSCKWGGLAALPGSWILSNGNAHAYWMWSHEFGHTLGASHPGSLVDCPTPGGDVQIGSGCKQGKVDDPSDTMGGGGRRLYPVSYQLFAGWLSDADVPVIDAVGSYTLAPLWGQQGGAKGYRINRVDGSSLWLEFRQPQRGFDNWKTDDPFVNGVIVRTVAHNGGNSLKNTLVDTTPGSPGGMKDAPLMPGHSLHDTQSGKIITVRSAGPDGAVIDVRNDGLLLPQASIDGPRQAKAGTVVTLSGAASAGGPLQYRWTAPAGLDVRDDGGTLRFTAPVGAQDRDHAFGLTVINDKGYASDATHTVKVMAEEVVAPPRASIGGPALVDGGARVMLSGTSSTGKGLSYRWSGPAGLAIDQQGASASFVAPKAAQERRYDVKLIVTDVQGRHSVATHAVTVRADAVEGAPAWDSTRTYATPCQKVGHAGKTWVNGWWVLGDEPGTGGEWAAWRPVGAANMHAQCKG
ncbi:carbohydrate-binding protein [Burkholderia stagnalis]